MHTHTFFIINTMRNIAVAFEIFIMIHIVLDIFLHICFFLSLKNHLQREKIVMNSFAYNVIELKAI